MELKATMLNINKGYNKELMEACRTLKDYAEYTARVREYASDGPLDLAVERAVDECIREGILEEFLRKNRAEAIKMSIYEYDEELHMRQTREEGWEDGVRLTRNVFRRHMAGVGNEEIASECGISAEQVRELLGELE